MARFEIEAAPYHPAIGNTYHILDNVTGERVPMPPYSDSKWGYEQLTKLCEFLNQLASPAPSSAHEEPT